MNKKTILLLLLAFIGITAQAAKTKTVVWNNPHFISIDRGSTFHITTVELKPDETVIHVSIKYHPKYWIRFDSRDYLIDEAGQHYLLLSGTHTRDGETDMPLNDYFWMPESGEVDAALHFQPLPTDTRCFDFAEPDDLEDGWAWWDIRDSKDKYRSPIPEDWHNVTYAKDETLPDAKVEKGTATLKVQLLGYKPGMKFHLYVGGFKPLKSPEYFEQEYTFNDEGVATAEIPLYLARAVNLGISEPRIFTSLVLAPGETTEMLIDLNNLKDPFVAFKGFLARTNFDSTRPGKGTDEQSQENSIKLLADIQKLKTPMERVQFFKKRLEASIAACNKEHKTSAWKALQRMMYEEDYFSWIEAFDANYADLRIGILFHNRTPRDFEEYDSINRNFHDEAIGMLRYPSCFEDQPEVLVREKEYFKNLEIMKAPYAPAAQQFWSVVEDEMTGMNYDLIALRRVVNNWHRKEPVVPSKDGTLLSFSDYFATLIKSPAVLAVLDEFKAEQEQLRQQLTAQSNVFYQQLDSVPPADILQTILDRYPDKVVLIDIWATWCGPCRHGHQQMASLKDEMAARGVQFVYITSPTSPLQTWRDMIQDIHGDHYYLTREQYDHVLSLYASNGIPTYAIYDRHGNRTYSHIGLPGNDVIRQELEKALE